MWSVEPLTVSVEERSIAFRSLTEGIDTSTASGKLTFHLFGALAQFERELMRERNMAGLAAARARGRVGGPPVVMTSDKVVLARQMYDSGDYSVERIGKTLGVSRRTVYRHLARSPS